MSQLLRQIPPLALVGLLAAAAPVTSRGQSLCDDFHVPAGHIGNVESCVFDGLGTTTVRLNSPAILHWDQFHIRSGQTLRFQSGGSAVLNRDLSGGTSRVSGSLLSDGRVILINPGGTIAVDVGGLIDADGGFFGSTLAPDDEERLLRDDGPVEFSGGGFSAIDNRGTIRSAGGDVVLLSGSVNNFGEGRIEAPGGRVGIAAATRALYSPADEPRITVLAGEGFENILNLGEISAQRAVSLSAFASAPVPDGQSNPSIINRGIIRTTGPGGQVLLSAGPGGGQVLNGPEGLIETDLLAVSAEIINEGNVVLPDDGSNPAAPSGARQFPRLSDSSLTQTPSSDFRLPRLSFSHLNGLESKTRQPQKPATRSGTAVSVRGGASTTQQEQKPKPAPKTIMLRRGAFFGKRTG